MLLITLYAPLSSCQPPISTVALDKNQNSSQFWLEMFKTVSETVSVGMVVADMNVPGCPLAYINEGFKTVTGKSKSTLQGIALVGLRMTFTLRTIL